MFFTIRFLFRKAWHDEDYLFCTFINAVFKFSSLIYHSCVCFALLVWLNYCDKERRFEFCFGHLFNQSKVVYSLFSQVATVSTTKLYSSKMILSSNFRSKVSLPVTKKLQTYPSVEIIFFILIILLQPCRMFVYLCSCCSSFTPLSGCKCLAISNLTRILKSITKTTFEILLQLQCCSFEWRLAKLGSWLCWLVLKLSVTRLAN